MGPAARCLSVLVALSMALPPSAMAREHLVAEAEIVARLQAAGAERAGNEPRAGVAALSDDELRDLASRADALETDPVAGGMVRTLLIVGVVVVIVLAILIVKDCKEQGAECLNN
jgi:hypothetical protein